MIQSSLVLQGEPRGSDVGWRVAVARRGDL